MELSADSKNKEEDPKPKKKKRNKGGSAKDKNGPTGGLVWVKKAV